MGHPQWGPFLQHVQFPEKNFLSANPGRLAQHSNKWRELQNCAKFTTPLPGFVRMPASWKTCNWK